jgi:hypothetical protein
MYVAKHSLERDRGHDVENPLINTVLSRPPPLIHCDQFLTTLHLIVQAREKRLEASKLRARLWELARNRSWSRQWQQNYIEHDSAGGNGYCTVQYDNFFALAIHINIQTKTQQ